MNKKLVLTVTVYSFVLAVLAATVINLCFYDAKQLITLPENATEDFSAMFGAAVLFLVGSTMLGFLALFCFLPIFISNFVFGLLFCIQHDSPRLHKTVAASCWMILPEFFFFGFVFLLPLITVKSLPVMATLLFLFVLAVIGSWVLRLMCCFKGKKES